MVRTQIQLTEDQTRRLRVLSAASGKSIAELVRSGVDRVLQDVPMATRAERMRHATQVFGAWGSGSPDTSARHDEHFADASARRR
jgi:hypothetical protein